MEIRVIFFYLFAAVLLFSAFRVVSARNPVHAVLYLIVSFIQMSCIWLLLDAEFLAVILAIIYLGAVVVLFLFVVMMVNIDFEEMRKGFWRYLPLASVLAALVVVQMIAVLWLQFGSQVQDGATLATAISAKEIGKILYTQYLYPVQIAAIILLVAMVAAISLTLYHRKNTLYVNPSEQVAVTAEQRLRIVKVPVVKPAPEPEPEPEPPAEAAAAEEKKS